MNLENEEIGVRATKELNLRVSVGTLVRVVFANPNDGRDMLALEHICTLLNVNDKSEIIARVKPFVMMCMRSIRLTVKHRLKIW